MVTETKHREKIRERILGLLGDYLIDTQLNENSINAAIDHALGRYRQSAGNAVEEAYAFLTLLPDNNTYYLPSETIEVQQIFRNRIGSASTSTSSSGGQFDPFNSAFTNMYLLQSSGQGNLLTYNLYNQYLNTAATMFGGYYNFTWHSAAKRLQIMRAIRAEETVLLWVYKEIPEEQLFADYYSGFWLYEASLAYTKAILGEARSKFQGLAGPNGGVTLNGDALKAESATMLERLDKELKEYRDGSRVLGVIHG